MFCIQEKESDPFANMDQDPLSSTAQSESSDDEPAAKRLKPTSYTNSALNLQVYKIPAFNTPKSLSIFPSMPSPAIRDLPQFVNNPLNLANPLAFAANNLSSLQNASSIVKSLQNRYSLPAKLTITPVQIQSPDGPATLFADELKQTLEIYLFGICPQTFKSQFSRGKNTTSCDVDSEQQDLAGRLATLSLRVHSAARADCSRLGAALAGTLGELARTAANRHAITAGGAADAANKKRKLSKSQKAKIQAKQRTALAVKKKAAAIAAKTAATSS